MSKFSRRQILWGGFITGAGISIASSRLNFQIEDTQNTEDNELLYSTDTSFEQVQELQKKFQLKLPVIPYDRSMSKMLVRCCRLATEQYLRGIVDSTYDGSIKSLPGYFPKLEEYEQVTSFKFLKKNFPRIKTLWEKVGKKNFTPHTNSVYCGFILKSPQRNIVIFRGTQQVKEWVANVITKQTYYQPTQLEMGKVHYGFNYLYRENLEPLVRSGVQQLDLNIPCYLAGHSLGGAICILASLDLVLQFNQLQKQMFVYTYGSPRVGDPQFAEFYSELIPNTYRIVNQADSTWLLPPIKINNNFYLHLGQDISFFYQTQDLSLNHQLTVYKQAIDKEVEKAGIIYEPISVPFNLP